MKRKKINKTGAFSSQRKQQNPFIHRPGVREMELGNMMFLIFLPQFPSSLSSVSLLHVLWMKRQGQKSYGVKNCALSGQGGACPGAFTVQGGNVSPTCRVQTWQSGLSFLATDDTFTFIKLPPRHFALRNISD